MKTSSTLRFYLKMSLFLMIFPFFKSAAQAGIEGNWEGTFMNDFKAMVHFIADDQNQFAGNIKMFAGENKIQDDPIINVNLFGENISFFIPAKETTFEGNFNQAMTELSGVFIFPDGSKHPIQLTKGKDIKDPVEQNNRFKNQYFTLEELRTDLAFLYLNLKKYHPQLYAHTSKDLMDILVEKLKTQIDTSYTAKEFYMLATAVTDAVHCSHTGVKLPIAYQKSEIEFGNYFPLSLYFSNGKAFYVSGLSTGADSIKPGEEIISINNMAVDKIIAQTFLFIPSEGYNTSTKYNVLNKKFNELFYLLADSQEFVITFKTQGTVKSVKVPASSFKELHLDVKTTETKVDYQYLDKMSAGMIQVPTFGIKNMDRYFYRLDSIFKDLQTRKAKNLILDLRDNQGGHPIFAAQLFSYLTDTDFVYFKRNDEIEEFEPLYGVMNPSKLNYNGNIYVLVNGGCLSTTGHLISLLKFKTDAVFIGEEPGSTYK